MNNQILIDALNRAAFFLEDKQYKTVHDIIYKGLEEFEKSLKEVDSNHKFYVEDFAELKRLRAAEDKVRCYLHGTPIDGDVFDYLINLNNINLVTIEKLKDKINDLDEEIRELETDNDRF